MFHFFLCHPVQRCATARLRLSYRRHASRHCSTKLVVCHNHWLFSGGSSCSYHSDTYTAANTRYNILTSTYKSVLRQAQNSLIQPTTIGRVVSGSIRPSVWTLIAASECDVAFSMTNQPRIHLELELKPDRSLKSDHKGMTSTLLEIDVILPDTRVPGTYIPAADSMGLSLLAFTQLFSKFTQKYTYLRENRI